MRLSQSQKTIKAAIGQLLYSPLSYKLENLAVSEFPLTVSAGLWCVSDTSFHPGRIEITVCAQQLLRMISSLLKK